MKYSYSKENDKFKVYLIENGHKISDFEFNKEECKELYVNLCEVLFEHDTLSTELKTFNQIDEEKHWQSIREHAAIAAMQGAMSILSSNDRYAFREIVVEGYSGTEKTYPKEIAEFAVACADALVEQLKKK